MYKDRIKELEKKITELKLRWPAHSVSSSMIQQLLELEEELEKVRGKKIKSNAKTNSRSGLC